MNFDNILKSIKRKLRVASKLMNSEIKSLLKTLPKQAGVYQYFDTNKRLLYVGKAKNLFNRVRSYFTLEPTLAPHPKLGMRISKMISEVVYLEYIVVSTEHDALLLENSLIKQLNPKYNILLRDDKTYPYLVIDNSQAYPRIEITREIIDQKKFTYFGPYSIGARDMYDSIYELLPLVQKKSCVEGKKACLYHQLQQCLAPCEGKVTTLEYKKILNKAISYIKNKDKLNAALEKKMLFYAEDLRFEEAQVLRDRMINIKKTSLSSPIDLASNVNYDIFAVAMGDKKALLLKLFMREGKIISTASTTIRISQESSLNDIYHRSLIDYYTSHQTIMPPEILLAHEIEEKDELQSLLSEHKQGSILLTVPQTSSKKELVDLALNNAQERLNKNLAKPNEDDLLTQLQELFKLDTLPSRIEVFDNSHLQGVACVGAMVSYENQKFDKKSYRTYHLDATNEYDQMRETLSRRIAKFDIESPPDLWLLDGGKALLNLALQLLRQAKVHIDVLAISKEKIDAKAHRAKGKAKDIISNKYEAFKLPSSDKRLQILQKLRDESHRFAISFHKKTKQKLDKESQLLTIDGVGPAKIKKLLNYFGSFAAIKEASFEEIRSIMSEKDSKSIKKHYL